MTRPSARTAAGAAPIALAGVVLWSTNAIAGSAALAASSVLQVVAAQFVAAAATLLLIRRATSRAAPVVAGRRVRDHAVGVVGLGGTMVLQYVAFANAPIVDANIIAYSWPMVAAVLLAVTPRGRSTLAGLVLSGGSFAGVGLIVFGQDAGAGPASGNAIVGYAAALGSAACMAFYTLAVRSVSISIVDLMLMTTSVGAVLAVGALAVSGTDLVLTPTAALALYVGVGPVALGYGLWSLGMRRSAGRLAPLGFMTPVLSTLVLIAAGRPLGGVTALGAVIVLLCTAAIVTVDRLGDRRL